VEQSFKNDEASIAVSLQRSTLEHDGSFVLLTGHKLVREAGFAQPWPGNKTNNLSLPLLRTLPCLADGTQFRLTSDQGCQPVIGPKPPSRQSLVFSDDPVDLLFVLRGQISGGVKRLHDQKAAGCLARSRGRYDDLVS
jgi:hypothetical protein